MAAFDEFSRMHLLVKLKQPAQGNSLLAPLQLGNLARYLLFERANGIKLVADRIAVGCKSLLIFPWQRGLSSIEPVSS